MNKDKKNFPKLRLNLIIKLKKSNENVVKGLIISVAVNTKAFRFFFFQEEKSSLMSSSKARLKCTIHQR